MFEATFKINYLRMDQSTKIHMSIGPRNLERRQLNWTLEHRLVSIFLDKRVSLTKIAILL